MVTLNACEPIGVFGAEGRSSIGDIENELHKSNPKLLRIVHHCAHGTETIMTKAERQCTDKHSVDLFASLPNAQPCEFPSTAMFPERSRRQKKAPMFMPS